LWTLLADRLPIDGRFIKFNDLPLGRCQIKLVGMDQMGNTSTRMTGIFDVRDGSGYSNPVQPVNDIEIDRLWSEALNLYQHKKYAESVDKYDRALAIAVDVSSERSDPLRHDKAVALYAKGQVEDARALLEGVVARNPDGLKYRYTLASVYLRSGSRAKAQSQCEEITKRDEVEPHVAARAMLASIHYQDGQTAKAEELWKSVVKHGSPASAEYKEAKMQLEAMEQRKKK
ncbi:MAG: tetratricopeptide repeat protein, partial [Planctomycetes bacterium]|nr:tetratricopeptide repeat protein [Planctomycetota bacterium]